MSGLREVVTSDLARIYGSNKCEEITRNFIFGIVEVDNFQPDRTTYSPELVAWQIHEKKILGSMAFEGFLARYS